MTSANKADTVMVEYIGTKESKSDNVAGTGVVWLGRGDVQPVPSSKWPLLAGHPGVWQLSTTGRKNAPENQKQAAVPESVTLLGSDKLDAIIDIGGKQFQLGDIVAKAHEISEMSVADWNAMEPQERDSILNDFIAFLRDEAQKHAQEVEQAAAKAAAEKEAAQKAALEAEQATAAKAAADAKAAEEAKQQATTKKAAKAATAAKAAGEVN